MLTDGDCSLVDGGPGCDEGASVNFVNNRYSVLCCNWSFVGDGC